MEDPIDAFALFRELADRSPAEREAYYAARHVPATVRADVESLLRFDATAGASFTACVASAAERVLLRAPDNGEHPRAPECSVRWIDRSRSTRCARGSARIESCGWWERVGWAPCMKPNRKSLIALWL
jgi:hypothetical protein